MRVTPRRLTSWQLILAGAAGCALSACSGAPPSLRTVLTTEAAGNYSYSAEQASTVVSDVMIPGPGGVLPALTIAGATRTSAEGRVASTYVVGRITSDRAYPTMGIAPGVNYVWRDTAGAVPSPYRLFIVPQDVAYPIFFLRKDTAYPRYAAGPAPQVVKSSAGVGACVEGCGMGHCPLRDTLRVYLQSDSTSVRVLL